jgi:threonine dehydrogenase-like Zn-dependent dehydrogenase
LVLNALFRSLYPKATILVSEPAVKRREFALKHGATQVFDPTKVNTPEAVRSIVGPGVDVAYDAAGIQASMDASLLSLRARGTYMNIAVWENDVTLNVNLILIREITFTGRPSLNIFLISSSDA